MAIFLFQSPSAEITTMSHHIWLAERPFLEYMGQDAKKKGGGQTGSPFNTSSQDKTLAERSLLWQLHCEAAL